MSFDSRPETQKHIHEVRKRLNAVIGNLTARALLHDASKLESPEREIFDEFTPKLKNSTYGSEEYKGFLREMKVGLDHHYAHNSHHPEHYKHLECGGCFKRFPNDWQGHCDRCGYSVNEQTTGIKGMTLLDLIEMLCDWKAATLRHADGDILKSIEKNQQRFLYSDELKQIFLNTLKEIEVTAEVPA